MRGADNAGGYGNPPRSGRFQKGQSGNSAGRPPGRHREPPYESVLGQIVTVKSDNAVRQVTAEEAFLEKLTEHALKGKNAAARAIDKLEDLRAELAAKSPGNIPNFVIRFVNPGSVDTALEPLKIATMLERRNETKARMMIEPWAVEAALERFGDRRLSRDEQEVVLAATRTPKKVAWPDWWEVLPD